MGDAVNQTDSPTVLLRRLHRWRMAFFGLVILLGGLLLGVAATLLTLHHAGPRASASSMSHFDFRGIEHRLGLSQEQAEKIRPILGKYMERLGAIREQGQSEIVKQLQSMSEEISVILHDKQEHIWQQLMESLPIRVPHRPAGGAGSGATEGAFGPPHVPAAGGHEPDAGTVPHN